MKKIFCIMLVLLMVGFTLVGCTTPSGNTDSGTNTEPTAETFDMGQLPDRVAYIGTERISYLTIIYYYDTITKVVYQFSYHSAGYGGGGSTVEVTDIDGNRIPYEMFIEQYKTLE